jgi:hypothetical protein
MGRNFIKCFQDNTETSDQPVEGKGDGELGAWINRWNLDVFVDSSSHQFMLST